MSGVSIPIESELDLPMSELLRIQLEEVKQRLIHEMTSQLSQIKLDILAEVKNEAQSLREEMQSMCVNLKNDLNQSIVEALKNAGEQSVAGAEGGQPEETKVMEEEVELHPEVQILAKTQEDEKLQMAAQLKALKLMTSQEPSHGSTLQGKTIVDICESIKGTVKAAITIQLTNYLETSLTNPQTYFIEGFEYRFPPKVIASYTREAFVFQSARGVLFAGDRVYGLFSYDLGTSDRRLIVKFACREDGLIMSGVALASREIPINQSTYEYLENSVAETKLLRTDLKNIKEWKTEGQEWLVKLQNIHVRVVMVPGPRAVMEIELAQSESRSFPEASPEKTKPVANGKTMLERFLPGMAAFINDKRVCIVELINLLNVPLVDSLRYIHNCKQHDYMPATVPAFTREAFFTSDDTIVEGVFSYHIATTDLRLAVVFRNQTEGNSLALSFVSADTTTDKKLMDYLSTTDVWKTRFDRKFANAKDGDQVVEIRNIRAVATMTDKEKVVMKVVVYAV